jgi:hypothetical protein
VDDTAVEEVAYFWYWARVNELLSRAERMDSRLESVLDDEDALLRSLVLSRLMEPVTDVFARPSALVSSAVFLMERPMVAAMDIMATMSTMRAFLPLLLLMDLQAFLMMNTGTLLTSYTCDDS